MTTALYRIGWIYNDLEDYNSAVDPLRQVVARQPNNAAASFELGYAYKKLERLPEALAMFNQTIRIKPDYAEQHTMRPDGSTTSRKTITRRLGA